MEDSLNYMNAVSEAGQALNQITALKNEAEYQFQQKKEQLGQELELPSEISITTAGTYLGKKVLGYVSEKFGSTIADVAGKAGISEETVGKALSGDISGAIESGTQELMTTAQSAVEGAVSQVQELGGMAVEEGVGVLGKIGGALDNLQSVNLSSITPELDVNNIYSQGLEDLRAQAGIDEDLFKQYTNVSIDELRPFSFNNPAPAEIEMTDFSNIGTTTSTATSTAESATAEAVATSGTAGEAGAEAGASAIAETTGEVAGAEAIGAGLDVTGVLAPLGALVGLIGGLVGFFEGHHQESETMTEAPTPILNPSAQFL